jgi:predicted lipoprotein with Yx(FWY)xxD motif
MKNNILALCGLVLVVIIGAWAYYAKTYAPAPAPTATSTDSGTGTTTVSHTGTKPTGTKTGTTGTTTQGPTTTPTGEPIPGKNLTLGIGGSGTNTYLVGYNGRALYTYDADKPTVTSACINLCAVTWPPYKVTSPLGLVAEYPIQGEVSTKKRYDDSLQVTYRGLPLYFNVADTGPGQTHGDGSGGVWHLARP